MADATGASGSTITWRELAFIPGLMAGCTRASTKTTRNTGMASTHGQTRDSTKAGGTKANRMVRASISCKIRRSNMDCGKTERE